PMRRQFADMHEPVTRPEKVHEGAEIDYFDNFPGIDHPDFRLGDDPANPVDRGSGRLTIYRGHLDRPIIVDVDLGPCGFGNLTNDLAARTDHLADFLLRDAERRDPRSILADLVPRTGQRFGHFTKDMQAAFTRLGQRDAHNLLGDRGDLNVHLQRRDTALGAGDFEVHIAQMVLIAENI